MEHTSFMRSLKDINFDLKPYKVKIISDKYLGSNKRHTFQCHKKHIWEDTPNNVKNKIKKSILACSVCNGSRICIEDLQKLAKKNKGELLSKKVLRSDTKYRWRCSNGHTWEATHNSVKNGNWCRKCSDLKRSNNLSYLNKIATQNNGKCLSKRYIDANKKYKWECSKGHTWEARPDKRTIENWCPVCRGTKKTKDGISISTLNQAQELASKFNGSLLTKIVKSSDQKLKFKCKNGHVFYSVIASLKKGFWCKFCNQVERNKKKLMRVKNKFRKLSIECLDKEPLNYEASYRFKCIKEQHEFKMVLGTVMRTKKNEICTICNGSQFTLQEMKSIVAKYNSKCLSKKYVSNKSMKWQCSKGHIWEETPGNLRKKYSKDGEICPYCMGTRKTKADLDILATEKQGKCLSRKYINANTYYKWRCSDGHNWEATYTSIYSGSWCPECSSGLSERICKVYFETIFDKEFKKTKKLSWLKNKEGNNLELDGYNEDLKIAFEHQGEHHYTKDAHYIGRELQKHKKVLSHDKQKEKLCEKNKVKLFIIPQLFTRTPLIELLEVIKSESKRLNVRLPKDINDKKFDLSKAYAPEKYRKLVEFAENKNGRLLSKYFKGMRSKYEWECEEGHKWYARGTQVVTSGSWCPICAGNTKSNISEMKKIALERKGKCLSKNYINNNTKLKWICEFGHTWEAVPATIKSGSWCPTCALSTKGDYNRLTIEEMHLLAKERKGKCLSKAYKNNSTKLKWKCSKGHIWEAPANKIKTGRWCPECAKKSRSESQKGSIQEIDKMLKPVGGKCLSKKYVNSSTRLKYQCSKGHTFSQTPNYIQTRIRKDLEWCSGCVKDRKRSILSIEDMKALAKECGGTCLSKEYKNLSIELEWKCKNGHKFKKKPSYIKKRVSMGAEWCPVCIKKK